MIIVIADVDEVAALLGVTMQREPEIVRPQTSGICVHYDPDGTSPEDGDGPDYREDPPLCAYPYLCKEGCPHLDNPAILCPVKDACAAMSEVARMRDACEAEQGHRDADAATREPVYETAAPEWVEPEPDDGALHTYTVPATRKPTNPNAWSDEEIEVIRRAQSADEAGRLYSETYGIWKRSRSAVTSRWYKLRAAGELIAPAPTPDFVGDTAPVTQCDEPQSTGAPPYPWTGARVQIRSLPEFAGQIGTVVQYDPDSPEMLVALDNSLDRIWLPPESLLLVGAGRGSP